MDIPLPPNAVLGFEAAGTVDAVGPGVTGTSVGGGVTALLFSLGGYAGLVVAQPREHQLGGYAGAHVSDHQGNVTGYAHGPEAAPHDLAESALPAAGITNAAAAAGVSGRHRCRRDRCRNYCCAATADTACLMRSATGWRKPFVRRASW